MQTQRNKPTAADQVLAERATTLAKKAGKSMTVHGREVAAVRRMLPRGGVTQSADALVALATDRSRKIKDDPQAKQVAGISEKIGNRFGPRVVAIIMAAVSQGIPDVPEPAKSNGKAAPAKAKAAPAKGKTQAAKSKAGGKGKGKATPKTGGKGKGKAAPKTKPEPQPEPPPQPGSPPIPDGGVAEPPPAA